MSANGWDRLAIMIGMPLVIYGTLNVLFWDETTSWPVALGVVSFWLWPGLPDRSRRLLRCG